MKAVVVGTTGATVLGSTRPGAGGLGKCGGWSAAVGTGATISGEGCGLLGTGETGGTTCLAGTEQFCR